MIHQTLLLSNISCYFHFKLNNEINISMKFIWKKEYFRMEKRIFQIKKYKYHKI